MFKKAVKVGAQNQLSGKDRKNIKAKLSTQFDPASIEAILAHHQKILCNKVTGSKMLIYVADEDPIFVDGTGKEDFFPSVYACSAYQTICKNLVLNEKVEAYIFNGANLMWPGVKDLSGLGDFKKDQVVSISDSNGRIVAVGAMGCSLDELKKNADGGGVATYILHYYGDKLWDMGSKEYPEIVMKAAPPKVEEPAKEEPKKDESKKEQPVKAEEQAVEQKGKGKAKKPKGGKEQKPVKEESKQTKLKKETIKEPEPEDSESDDDLDFGAMIHTKKTNQPQIKMEKKKVATFSDEQDDKKGKKKAGKKAPQKKKEQSQEDEPVVQKHKQSEDNTEGAGKKGKGKKGKGKKQAQESDEEKEEPKKAAPKKKQEKAKRQEDQEEEEDEVEAEEKVEKQDKQEKSAISGQLMDQYFKEAFLNALKLAKVELPIDSGRFFSDYMVFARGDDVQLSIKDSSFKKLGRFYEEMAKQKIIEFKPAKQKKGQQGSTITKIFWENEELKNYVPTIRRLGEKEVEEKGEVFSKEKLVLTKTMTVEVVFKLNQQLEQVLLPKKKVNYMPDKSDEEEEEAPKQKQLFLTEKQLKQKVEKYINTISIKEKEKEKEKDKQKEKEKGDKGDGKERKTDKLVTLSYKDNNFIFNLLKQEIEDYEQNLQKAEMMEPNDSDEEEQGKKKGKKDKNRQNFFRIQRGYLSNKMVKLAHPYYQLLDKDTGFSKFKEGTFKGIQLMTDKVMNKNVTKIVGLQTFIPSTFKEDEIVKQIHGFAHYLQLKFACSATVQNLPGKNAGKEIVIQGHFVDELEALLMQEYDIKKQCITIQNKLGNKKKK